MLSSASRDANDPQLLVAFSEPPYLSVGAPGAGFEPISSDEVAGIPRLPSASETGLVAYNFIIRPDRPLDWVTGTAVLDREGRLFDIIPDTLSHVRPAWTRSGSLVTARRQPSGTVLIVTETQRAEERQLPVEIEIRSIDCIEDRRWVLTSADSLIEYDETNGKMQLIWRDDVSSKLAAFGSDDLYVTLDDVCYVDHQIFFRRTWHEAGKRAVSHLAVWCDKSDVEIFDDSEIRSFRFWRGWRGVVQGDVIELTKNGDERTARFDNLHSFDFVRNMG